MRVRARDLTKQDKIKFLDALYTAASVLKSREDIKNFLRDLLTESERIMLGKRITVAKELLKGKSYDEIIKELKVGADTIAKIDRWLNDELRGYEKAIEGAEEIYKKREDKKLKIEKEKLERFLRPRRKYSLPRFLYGIVKK